MRCFLAALLFGAIGSTASADLIAYWNFNGYDGNSNPGTVSADSGVGTLSFSSGLSNTDVDNPATGTTLNAVGADAAGRSLSVINGSPSNNGEYIELAFSLLGFENLILTYATIGDEPGFDANQWAYSIDGGGFTDFGAAVNPTSTYSLVTRDFSSVAALDDAASIVLRYTFNGGNPGVGNINRTNQLDNIQLNASAISAVPEPGSLVLAGLGAAGLAFGAIRRRRSNVVATCRAPQSSTFA